MARVIQVIETTERVGTGTADDPLRNLYQLWTFEGNLIHQKDPLEFPKKEIEENKNE